ncbi:acetate--CoA ligase family protein [Paraburkholderia caribensis]|uniref:acetate--CoA ligase family protein n=1 Tax=Paraburkholderia caribensis TaxID=75105 RepID=UPI00158FDC12|nr:acetate--CoA ligase [Paraburkholderia caribensis]
MNARIETTLDAISLLMQPRSVAVIGASSDPSKTAARPVAYLRKHGFSGVIYPVNPRIQEIDGLRCYPDIGSLPEVPDVAIILLGVHRALEAVRELARKGTAVAIVLASGYREVGPEGAERQRELVEAAGNMRLLGPNTIGLVNLTDRITLSATGALEVGDLEAGSVGVISQSGGILGSLLSRASARGVGLSKLVSTSNEADLEVADLVDYLVDDPATKVIALYLETLRDPAKFRYAADRARKAGKPIVVFKVGRSDAGVQSAVSHTGALAGSDRMYDALFRQLGVIRAQTFADLLDIPAALASGRQLTGKRVAILTSTGGAGTLVADSLGMCGFETPVPDEGTAARLRELQDGDHAVLDRNPIDVTLAGLQPTLLRSALRALMESPTYDAIVVVVGSSALAMPELMSGAIVDSLPASGKPILAYVSPQAPELIALFNRQGIPAFAAPESCTVALDAMYVAATLPGDTNLLNQTLEKAQVSLEGLPTGCLDEVEAKQLFARFSITGVEEVAVTDAKTAEAAAMVMREPVVLKILSREITHKSDVGGVAINVEPEHVAARLERMREDVRRHTGREPDRYVVQRRVVRGVEVILGMHRDPLGTAILLGMGGVTAELFKDTTLRILTPGQTLTTEEAVAMVHELKTWPLLDGYRGRARCDVSALVQSVVAFSAMVSELGDALVEAEINPLFVLEEGKGVVAADGVVVLGELTADKH